MDLERVITSLPANAVTRFDMSEDMVRLYQNLVRDCDLRLFTVVEGRRWQELRYIAGQDNLSPWGLGFLPMEWQESLRDNGVLFPAGTLTRHVLEYVPGPPAIRMTEPIVTPIFEHIPPIPNMVFTNVNTLREAAGMITNAPMTIPPTPVTPRPKVRVKVWKDTGTYSQRWLVKVQQITIAANGVNQEVDMRLPTTTILKGFLPENVAAKLPGRRRRGNCLEDILSLLDNGVRPQAIHDGLKAWAFSVVSQPTSAESEGEATDETAALLHAAPATLEVGGRVFRLVPTGEVDVRPVITRIRRKVIASSQAEAVIIKDRAQADARLVVSQAEERAATLRAQLEQERALRGAAAPDWVISNGITHKYKDGRWHLLMEVDCRITEIRLTVTLWNKVFYWNPVLGTTPTMKMPVWLRWISPGSFTMDSCYMQGYKCTHISNERACMELQGLPSRVDSHDNYLRLRDILSRGLKVVNLNSPLIWDTTYYWPEFKAQLPPMVMQYLAKRLANGQAFPLRYDMTGMGSFNTWRASYPSTVVNWDREESIEQEAEGTFATAAVQAQLARDANPTPAIDVDRLVAAVERTRRE